MNDPQIISCEQSEIIAKQKEILRQPYDHIRQCPLPLIWEKLGRAFKGWFNISEKDFKTIEEASKVQQYSNMILEDIQYDRKLRGSISTVHSVYNTANAISAYMCINIDSATQLSTLSVQETLSFEHEAIKSDSIARYMQLKWSADVSCPTEEEYYKMIIRNTQALLAIKIKYMQSVSKSKKDFTKLGHIFGLYLCILEDYCHLKSKDENSATFCEDITLARFTLPTIHAIRNQTQNGEKVLDIFRQRTQDKEVKKYCVTLLESCGSFAYTRKILRLLEQEAVNEIKKMEKNSLMEKFIEEEFDKLLHNNEESDAITVEPKITSFFSKVDQLQLKDEEKCLAEQVLKPLTHLEAVSSKNIRSKVIHIIEQLLNVDKQKVDTIEHILIYMHAASLLIDDIQDDSILRRGLPCSYKIYGIMHTVTAATYMSADIYLHAMSLDNPKTTEICLKHLEAAARGQYMDVYWRDNFICPTEAEYIEMVLGKTGAAFLIVGELMQLFTSTTRNLMPVLRTLGLLFQINDDYQNLTNQFFYDTKGFCEDITEGKFSFPVVHAVNTHPKEGRIILDILRQKTDNVETKKYCLSLLEKCGSLKHTKRRVEELTDNLDEELKHFGTDISVLKSILAEMNVQITS